jgi:hypothetical protein
MLWAVLLAIGTFGNVLGSFTLSAEYGSFLKAPLLAVGGITLVGAVVQIGTAVRYQREWREAVERRDARLGQAQKTGSVR